MYLYIIIYFVIIILSLGDYLKKDIRIILSLFVFIGLVLFVSGRGSGGADSLNYLVSWDITPTIFDENLARNPMIIYSEPGYYFITVILKTINQNPYFYFLTIATISLSLLFKSLWMYSVYPLMSLLVYMSRYFILREFNQIRAAVAIAFIVYAIKYMDQRNATKFILFWTISMFFHTSAIIILPFMLFNSIGYTKKNIYSILLLVFFVSAISSEYIKLFIDYISGYFGVLSAYTGDGVYVDGYGILNPMIYFQVAILILFIEFENRLKDKQPYYYTIRNGYLYSTLLLMLFSSTLVIGSRLSTIMATLDIFIIPAIISVFNKRSRVVMLTSLYIILSLIYLTNLLRAGDLTYGEFNL